MELISPTLGPGFEPDAPPDSTAAAEVRNRTEDVRSEQTEQASKAQAKRRKGASSEVGSQAPPPSLPNRAITFRLSRETGRIVIQVVDRNTGEIIRQIPAEEMMELAEGFGDSTGHLFNTSA